MREYLKSRTALQLLDQYERPIKYGVGYEVYYSILEKVQAMDSATKKPGQSVLAQNDLADMYARLLHSTSFVPPMMQVQLKFMRELQAYECPRQQVADFLKAAEAVPEEAIVVLTKDSIAFLTDENDHLLCFA